MAKQAFSGQRQGEELLFVFRQHWIVLRRGVLILLVLSLIGFAPWLISPNNTSLAWFGVAGIGLGALALFYHWIGWYFTVYIVTNERVRQVRQKGLFSRSVVEVELVKIHNISYDKSGIVASIFNYGTLVLQTFVGDMLVRTVPQVEKVHDQLLAAAYAAGGEITGEKNARKA
jgi:hypothetical protein